MFEKGNKLAQEWTLENAEDRFQDALKYAETNDDCLCLQDAIYYSGIPYSTFDYLADTHAVLGILKENIRQALIRRINKNALDKDTPSPSAASIWRMKQLGEKDQQYIDQNVNKSKETKVIVADKETAKNLKGLIKDLEKE